MAIAYDLGYDPARYYNDNRKTFGDGFDPERHAYEIINTFSHPEIQIPQFVEGAEAFLDENHGEEAE